MAKVKIHKHYNYEPPKVKAGSCGRQVQVVPRQSMSLDDVMRRFTRGLPVDMKVHPNIYYKGRGSVDYERMSKLDFDEKAAIAAEEKAKAERLIKLAKEAKEEQAERAKEQSEKERDYAERNRDGQSRRAVEDLDATLPDDTERGDRGVSKGKVRKSSNR